jgi:hypothetical protein
VPDVEVQKSKASAPKQRLLRLREILERLPAEQRPARVRGDSAFGNEGAMAALEDLKQADLSKLRRSAGVKRLIERQESRHEQTRKSLLSRPPSSANHGGYRVTEEFRIKVLRANRRKWNETASPYRPLPALI